MVTLGSSLHDSLPDDEDGFLEYARSLAQPDVYEAIKDAEPLTPVLTYKYSANRWQHYERMPHFLEGFVIMGDAVCSFNPVYGQGMTVAALEAKTLDACLRQYPRGISKQESGFAQRFQKAIAKVVQGPWQMATGADLLYSETKVEQSRGMRLFNWYMLRVSQLTLSNPLVADQFNRVVYLLKPPTALLDPRIVWAVLKQELASRRSKQRTSLPPDETGPLALTRTLDAATK